PGQRASELATDAGRRSCDECGGVVLGSGECHEGERRQDEGAATKAHRGADDACTAEPQTRPKMKLARPSAGDQGLRECPVRAGFTETATKQILVGGEEAANGAPAVARVERSCRWHRQARSRSPVRRVEAASPTSDR